MKRRLGPDGIHLFDRTSGLNVLIDEVAVPEHLWSKAPRQVSIALTNTCDLSCAYCYAPKHRAMLSSDRLREWLVELDDAGTLGVGFGGGEPTLFRELAQVCAYATEHTGLAITMTTHAQRWDTELSMRLRGALNFVRVSVDGVGDTYERLRGRSFTVLRERLDLIAADFRFGVNCVVNEDTLGELPAIADLAAEHGAAEILLLPEQPTGKRPGASRDVQKAIADWALSYTGGIPIAISENASSALPIAAALPKEAGLRSYAHIDASGVARASSYSPEGVIVGEDGVMAAFRRLASMEAA